TRGARWHSVRWAPLSPAPRRWPAGTVSRAWLCRHGCTRAVGRSACPRVARTDRAVGWPGTGQPHPGTTRGCRPPRRRDRPGRSTPFCLGVRIDDGHHARLALALGGAGRTPGACPLIGTASVLGHASDGARPERGEAVLAQAPLQG